MMGINVLPTEWVKTNLGKIAEIHQGVGFSKNLQGHSEGEVPFYKVSDIANAVASGVIWLKKSNNYVSRDQAIKIRPELVPKGSVVFAKIGEAVKLNRRSITTQPCLIDNNVAAVKGRCGIDKLFVFYFLTFTDLGSLSRATTVPSIRKSDLQSVTFPLPPENEQRRIVAKIEELFSELDKGVESLKTARAQLKTYRQSLLKAAFEGRLTEQWRRDAAKSDDWTPVSATLAHMPEVPRPNRWKTRSKDVIYSHPCLAVGNPETPLPNEWQWVPLVEVAKMESGHTPSRRHPEWWDGDIPWIGIADARANNGRVINMTTQTTNKEGLANSAARLLPAGTVCVSRTASVGYVVEMGCDMATSQDFVNWVPSEAVTSAWLRLVFGAHKEYLLRFSKGTTHRTIYFPEWLSVHIGLPPIEEQHRIVEQVEAKLSELDVLEGTIEKSLGQSDALRQSILKRAFEGKLVPQDPNDEPASALLERIRQEQADAPKAKRRQRQTESPA